MPLEKMEQMNLGELNKAATDARFFIVSPSLLS